MHAEQRRHAVLLQVARDGLVGRQHELLDQPVRQVAFRGDDCLHAALVIHQELRLGQVEVDRSPRSTPAVQQFEQLGHALQMGHEAPVLLARGRILPRKDAVDLRVRHPGVAADQAVVQLVAPHGAALVDLHEARLREAVHLRPEAAQSRRKRFGKHVDGTVREIDGGAPLQRRRVECALLPHVVGDVRDMHAEPEVAVRQPLDRDRVVEVARGFAVDGHRGPAAEVPPSELVARTDPRSRAPGFGQRRRPVLVGQLVLADDQPRVHAGRVDIAEHRGDAADRVARGRGPARDLDLHHLAGHGGRGFRARHMDIHHQPPVEWNDVRQTGIIDVVAAGEALGCALEDTYDAPLAAIRRAPALDARHDPVAVHRLVQVGAGNVEVAVHPVDRVLRRHEAESPRMHLDRTGHQPHPVRQAVAVAPDPDELAGGDQRRQTAAERAALRRRQPQLPQQLADRGRMVERRLNACQQLVRRRWLHGSSSTCRSPTFVAVGPIFTRSPNCSKKVYESLRSR